MSVKMLNFILFVFSLPKNFRSIHWVVANVLHLFCITNKLPEDVGASDLLITHGIAGL